MKIFGLDFPSYFVYKILLHEGRRLRHDLVRRVQITNEKEMNNDYYE